MVDRYEVQTFSLLPRYFRETDTYGYLQKFFDAFDAELKLWSTRLDELERFRDIDLVPEGELQYKIANYGGEIPLFFPEATRRGWVSAFIPLLKDKGDHQNIVRAIRVVLGITVLIQSYWNNDSVWSMGTGLIGVDTYIGGMVWEPLPDHHPMIGENFYIGSVEIGAVGKNIHLPRTFVVKSLVPLTPKDIEVVRYLINKFKPAEEHWILITPVLQDQWELGDAELGIDTVLNGDCWKIGFGQVGVNMFICSPAPADPEDIVSLDDAILPDALDPADEPAAILCSGSFTPFVLDPSPVIYTSTSG